MWLPRIAATSFCLNDETSYVNIGRIVGNFFCRSGKMICIPNSLPNRRQHSGILPMAPVPDGLITSLSVSSAIVDSTWLFTFGASSIWILSGETVCSSFNCVCGWENRDFCWIVINPIGGKVESKFLRCSTSTVPCSHFLYYVITFDFNSYVAVICPSLSLRTCACTVERRTIEIHCGRTMFPVIAGNLKLKAIVR